MLYLFLPANFYLKLKKLAFQKGSKHIKTTIQWNCCLLIINHNYNHDSRLCNEWASIIQRLQLQLSDKKPLLQPNQSLLWISETTSLFPWAWRFLGSIGSFSRWFFYPFQSIFPTTSIYLEMHFFQTISASKVENRFK